MSTRKGDNKKKGQRYQNRNAFKNNLHDTSQTRKLINGLVVRGVCDRCKEIIEWKKKYKKYKPLTTQKKCVKCGQKAIKHAYHTICASCAVQNGVCEKCGTKGVEIERSKGTDAEQAAQDSQMQAEIKCMSERERRTFFRALEQGTIREGSEAKNNEDSDEGSSKDEAENGETSIT